MEIILQARSPQAGGVPLRGGVQQNRKRTTTQAGAKETWRCNKCGIVGHIAADCRRGVRPAGAGQVREQPRQGNTRELIRCYECGVRGHIAINCLKNAYFYKAGRRKARSGPERRQEKK